MEDLNNKSDAEIAALAVRANSRTVLTEGLDTLFSSNAVYDYRDIISALALYYDAASRLGLEPNSFMLDYADRNPLSKEHITNFVRRTPELKSLAVGGYRATGDPEFHYSSG